MPKMTVITNDDRFVARAAESQGADRLAGRGALVGGEASRPTPRGPTATSRLTGRPLRRFDVS